VSSTASRVYRLHVVGFHAPTEPLYTEEFLAGDGDQAYRIAEGLVAKYGPNPDLHYGDLYRRWRCGDTQAEMVVDFGDDRRWELYCVVNHPGHAAPHRETAGTATQPDPAQEPRELAVHLAEYAALKQEQTERIKQRDRLIYAALVAGAAVGSFAATRGLTYLLLLPAMALLLGWTYLVNDKMVTDLGRYLREGMGPALSELVGRPVLGWEDHRGDPDRPRRKQRQLAVDLLAFTGMPAVALAWFWTSVQQPAPILAGVFLPITVLELAALAALAREIVRYAELTITTPDRQEVRRW